MEIIRIGLLQVSGYQYRPKKLSIGIGVNFGIGTSLATDTTIDVPLTTISIADYKIM